MSWEDRLDMALFILVFSVLPLAGRLDRFVHWRGPRGETHDRVQEDIYRLYGRRRERHDGE